MRMNYLVVALALLAWCGMPATSFAQLVNTNFGQNRLQYEKYKWFRYESNNFAISFPEELEELADFAVETAENDYAQLKNVLEYQSRNKIEIMVYGDYSDYLQNNIGLYSQTVNNGGTTKLFSHKILLYFNGNHHDLRNQVREGIARALVNRMVFGGNFQEVVQNAVSLQLPLWFTEGMVAYAVEEWNIEADAALREIFLTETSFDFLTISRRNPRLAGQSMFHFIAQKYSNSSVSNLLYLTRSYRSVESGYLYAFGTSFFNVASNWFTYYQERYNKDNAERRIPSKGDLTLRAHRHAKIAQPHLSPDGKHAAYIELHKGKQTIWLHELATDKATAIWKGGRTDRAHAWLPNFPRLGWSANGLQLYFFTNTKNKLQLQKYSVRDKKLQKPLEIKDLEFVTGFDAWNSQEIVASGIRLGRTDIYTINTQTGKATNLTNDLWDDAEPAVVKLNGMTGVAFSSARNRTSLATIPSDSIHNNTPFDLYFYNLDAKNNQLIRLTNTPFAHEAEPIAIDSNYFAFLSDYNGIQNRFVGKLDSFLLYNNRIVRLRNGETHTFREDAALDGIDTTQIDTQYISPVYELRGTSYANTDYSRSINEHHASAASQKILDMIFYRDSFKLFVREARPQFSTTARPTQYRELYNKLNYPVINTPAPLPSTPIQKNEPAPNTSNGNTENAPRSAEDELKAIDKELREERDTTPPAKPTTDTTKIDVDNYFFQSEFKDIKNPPVTNKTTTTPAKDTNVVPQPTILVEGSDGNITKQTPKPKTTLIPTTKQAHLQYRYDPSRKTVYRNLFRADAFTLQADNTPLFGGLDMYIGNYYRFTPLMLATKANFSDIFENYRLELGVRIPITFNGFDCYFVFEDRKGKLDKRYSFYRRGRVDNFELVDTSTAATLEAKGRNIKHLAQFELRYPLNAYESIRGMVAIQGDKIAIIAQEQNSLQVPIFLETRTWLRGEYVFDNTVDMRLNIRKGTRFKAYVDVFKPFAIKTQSGLHFDGSGAMTTNIGFDYRRYFSLDNRTIFAVRAAGAASMGKNRILYSLGGVENWLFNSTNTTIPLPSSDNFAYQTLAAPLRGFQNNIRNGSSFTVINAELRIPIIEYIANISTRSNFWRSFQLVPFFDIGTAWHGASPFAKNNPLNTTLIDRSGSGSVSPVRVRVNYYRQPIVMAFGMGFRTVLSGYFLRADLGFGVETGILQSPTLQFGIGTDF